MRPVRLSKAALVGAVALLFSAFALGNLTDYNSNWQFVRHVMAMDTVFPDSTLRWRAVTNPAVQMAAYGAIIATQTAVAVTLWIGAIGFARAVQPLARAKARGLCVCGLTAGILLYAVGFVVVAGEWFAMWQSDVWNGQDQAFRFIGLIGLVLIVVLLPETEEDVST